jgi:hypothetical protein
MFGLRLARSSVRVPSRLVEVASLFCTKLYRQRDIAPADCGEASGMSIFPNWVLLTTTQARAAQNSRPRVCACTFSKRAKKAELSSGKRYLLQSFAPRRECGNKKLGSLSELENHLFWSSAGSIRFVIGDCHEDFPVHPWCVYRRRLL